MIAYEESDDLILKDSPEALADFSADVFVTVDVLEDIGEDEPSRMGGESAEAYCAGVAAPVLEAAKERGVAPDSDLDELGTVDKIDVVDKSENRKRIVNRFLLKVFR